jgi:transcriptional activator HAC1
MNLLRRLLACSPKLARPLMDATMGAMRLASEQHLLAHVCLDGGDVDAHDRSRAKEPSMECLMTLLWATDVIDRELRRQEQALMKVEEVDPATEIRQACKELDELFRSRNISMRRTNHEREFSFVGRDQLGGRGMQKSYGRPRSLAFKHDH